MRNPKTSAEFHALVMNMQHRERFLFKAGSKVDGKYGKPCFVEVYNADLTGTVKTNVSISLVDTEGTRIVGIDGKFANKPIIFNKLKSLFTEEYAITQFAPINPAFLASKDVDAFGYPDVVLVNEISTEVEAPVAETTETQTEAEIELPVAETTEIPTAEENPVIESEAPVAEIAKVVAESTEAPVAETKPAKKGNGKRKPETEKVA